MSKGTQFFERFARSIKLDIHTNLPARVVVYHADAEEADVLPLFLQVYPDGETAEYPLLTNVPILEHVKVPLEKGDVVRLSIMERAIDELQAQPFDPDSRRLFDLRDAVIDGKFRKRSYGQ